jgi:hypothetical protein
MPPTWDHPTRLQDHPGRINSVEFENLKLTPNAKYQENSTPDFSPGHGVMGWSARDGHVVFR